MFHKIFQAIAELQLLATQNGHHLLRPLQRQCLPRGQELQVLAEFAAVGHPDPGRNRHK